MLGHIFYATGLVVLLMLLSYILQFSKIYDISRWYKKFKEKTNKVPVESDFNSKDDFTLFNSSQVFLLIDIIWLVGGLLTSSWYIFLFLIILFSIIKNIDKLNLAMISKIVFCIFYSFKFIVYLYLIINHFHLHIDTLDLVKELIK
jgi:hypothetical protein